MYFHADKDGEPDLSSPFSHEESVESYWATADDDPTGFADLYLDFQDFRRIEFLLFKDRLSGLVRKSFGD
jgi:hypothetical protein